MNNTSKKDTDLVLLQRDLSPHMSGTGTAPSSLSSLCMIDETVGKYVPVQISVKKKNNPNLKKV